MGAIGHVRIDFGKSGTEFWHTWFPRGDESLNSASFKAELTRVVDQLRESVLKDLRSMSRFCYENGGMNTTAPAAFSTPGTMSGRTSRPAA